MQIQEGKISSSKFFHFFFPSTFFFFFFVTKKRKTKKFFGKEKIFWLDWKMDNNGFEKDGTDGAGMKSV